MIDEFLDRRREAGNELGCSVFLRASLLDSGPSRLNGAKGKTLLRAAAEETTVVALAIVAKRQIGSAVGFQVVELAVAKIDGIDCRDAFVFEAGPDHDAGSTDLFLCDIESHFSAP